MCTVVNDFAEGPDAQPFESPSFSLCVGRKNNNSMFLLWVGLVFVELALGNSWEPLDLLPSLESSGTVGTALVYSEGISCQDSKNTNSLFCWVSSRTITIDIHNLDLSNALTEFYLSTRGWSASDVCHYEVHVNVLAFKDSSVSSSLLYKGSVCPQYVNKTHLVAL